MNTCCTFLAVAGLQARCWHLAHLGSDLCLLAPGPPGLTLPSHMQILFNIFRTIIGAHTYLCRHNKIILCQGAHTAQQGAVYTAYFFLQLEVCLVPQPLEGITEGFVTQT